MRRILFSIIALLPVLAIAQTTAKRKLKPSDVYRLQTLGDPQVSPEANWLAYTLTTTDSALNKRNTDIWMISWDGKQQVQLTNSADAESSPRFSPDGKYLSFIATRQGATTSQIWLMNRLGGEGKQLTNLKDNLRAYAWSPDGKKILLTLQTPLDTTKPKTPKPIVVNRYAFKRDIEGYITQRQPVHLYLLDVETKK